MRKLALACLLSLYGSIAQAQAFESRKPVLCDNVQTLIQALMSNYNEKPVWTAKNPHDDTRFALFLNSQTGEWTLLQMTTEVACIIGVGENSQFHWEKI